MTHRHDKELRRALDAWRRELERELDLELAKIRTNKGDEGAMRGGSGAADPTAADLEERLAIALLETKVEALLGVRDALARLARGEYGYCAECNEEIDERRLSEFPLAARCAMCEELSRLASDDRARPL